jgi:hypothetical protein
MRPYHAFFFILLCCYTYGHACDRCNAIDTYAQMHNGWDQEYRDLLQDKSCLYWYLEGRLSAWDEIKYVEAE